MRTAKLIVSSERADTYVDVLAAIAADQRVDEVVFITLDSTTEPRQLLRDIQRRLVDLADIPAYEEAARLKISSRSMTSDVKLLLRDCELIDVTAVPKEKAIEIAAVALSCPKIRVCNLRWLEKFDGTTTFRVGVQKYTYADVISESALRSMRSDYVAKKYVIRVFGSIFAAMAVLAIAQLVFQWAIPEKWISELSLLVGIGGLQLAYVSLKRL